MLGQVTPKFVLAYQLAFDWIGAEAVKFSTMEMMELSVFQYSYCQASSDFYQKNMASPLNGSLAASSAQGATSYSTTPPNEQQQGLHSPASLHRQHKDIALNQKYRSMLDVDPAQASPISIRSAGSPEVSNMHNTHPALRKPITIAEIWANDTSTATNGTAVPPARGGAPPVPVPNGKAQSPVPQEIPQSVSSSNPKAAAQQANDMTNIVRRKLTGYVGFANLPNQWHRKSVRKGFNFNVMVVGEWLLIVKYVIVPH